MKTKFKLIRYCFIIMLITSCGKSEPPSAEIMNLPVGVIRNGQPVLLEKTLSEFTDPNQFLTISSSKWIKVNENTWNYKYEFTNQFKKNVTSTDTYTKIDGAVIFSRKVFEGEPTNFDQRLIVDQKLNSLNNKITE